MLLRETGARAVHLPVWETLCCGALTLAAHGTDEQRADLLPGVADRRDAPDARPFARWDGASRSIRRRRSPTAG